MSTRHQHVMKPIERGIWGCTSCAFRCLETAVHLVRQHPDKHRLVKPGSPEAAEVWGS